MTFSLARLGMGFLALAMFTLTLTAQSGKVVIVQTNSAGDSVHLIDPTSDKIVAEIPDAEVIHGVAAAPDGSRFYLSNESTDSLDIVDVKTLRIRKKIPLTTPGRPNNVAIRKDGQRLYVAIQGPEGGVDVIDTVKEEKVKFIRVLARRAQHLHHAGQQVRRRRFHRRQRGDGDRHRNRDPGVVDSLRRRRAPDLFREEP